MSIDLLSLRRFKCFTKADVRISPLTLLSGFNGAGKSTLLQSLLLLAQGLRMAPLSKYLPLNGPSVRLGSSPDVRSFGSKGPIVFRVEGFGEEVRWDFSSPSSSPIRRTQQSEGAISQDFELDFDDISETRHLVVENVFNHVGGVLVGNSPVVRLTPRGQAGVVSAIENLIYLGPSRRSGLDVFPSPDIADPIHANVGREGQFAPWWYVRRADSPIAADRRHPNDQSVTMRAQVDAWLGHLFPGAAANVEPIVGTGMARLVFKIGRSGAWSNPANIGFGLSYAFPLVVALLNARPSQVIVVDSPEAHLHPRAQSQMGGLLAHFVAAGLQIIVETHSDHILSGIRLAVRSCLLSSDNVAIHFFSGNGTSKSNGIVTPILYPDGRLSDWPSGFFDQSDIDLAQLV